MTQRPPFAHGYCAEFNPKMIYHMMDNFSGYMPYDLEEDEESGSYLVTMPLPGYKVDEVEVSIKGNNILIEAKKKENESENNRKRKVIIDMGGFLWKRPIRVKIPIEDEINPNRVKAKLKHGILKVKFVRVPGKDVPINVD